MIAHPPLAKATFGMRGNFSRLARSMALSAALLPGLSAPAVLAAAQTSAIRGTAETVLERAFVLDEGVKVTRDAAAAAALYQAAADSGDAFAHLRLGYLAETGDGVPQDYAVARAHYQAAADAGLKEARLRLAICHLEGWGGPVDRSAFVRELHAAAEADHIPAQQILGTIYGVGLFVPVNRAEAVKWLERAASLDDPHAQYDLGLKAEKTRLRALMPDLALARNWYQLSAEQEYQTAMRAMARTFLTGKRSERNWELGHRWLELAAESGDAEAPFILAVFELLHEDAPRRDVAKAQAWLQLASERQNERATEILQEERGGRDLTEAMKYVLSAPLEDRYPRSQNIKRGDGPNRAPVPYRVVQPVYPTSFQLTRTPGEVLVEFIVDRTGRVSEARVINASHPLFAEPALVAVRQWRFHPGRKDGQPVDILMRLPFHFSINDGEQLRGIEGLFSKVRNLAQTKSPDVFADTTELRIAMLKMPLPLPVWNEGEHMPTDAAVLMLLVLDKSGRPVRGHVLLSKPETLGPMLLETALAHEYLPRLVNGEAIPSNVILVFSEGRYRNPMPRKE